MRTETKDKVHEILKWIVAHPIPLTWRSSTVMPSAGERRSRSRGSSGFDLATRQLYEPGDDPRDIDWFATAQTGGNEIYTVQYYDPRDTKFFVLVDTSITMDFGTVRTTKRNLAAEIAGSIVESAAKTGDRIGLVAFSENDIERYIPPKAAKMMLLPTVATTIEANSLEDHPVSTRKTTDKAGKSGMTKALMTVNKHSKSLVFLVSDFLNFGDEEKKLLKRLSTRHDVVCIVVQDRRERELPSSWLSWLPTLYTFSDLRTGERRSIWLTRKNRAKFEQSFQAQQTALFESFRASHCDSTVISTEEGLAAHSKLLRLFAGHRR